jgi:hypothetical protein
MRRQVDVLNPDLVVMAVFADNDFGDLIRNKIFRIGPDGRLARHRFSIDSGVVEYYAAREALSSTFALHRAALDPSIVRRDLRILVERTLGIESRLFADTPIETAYRTDPAIPWIDVWLKRGREEFADYVERADSVVRIDNIRSDHYDADISLFPDSESTRYKTKLMELVVAAIARFLRQRYIPLVILIIPSPIDVCRDYDWQVDTARYPAYERETLTGLVERLSTKTDIPYLNLFPHFSESDCNSLYFHHGNNHWTEAGQWRAAGLLAEFIDQSRIISSGNR